jgi:TetR/AcrR family transcriptional regulator
MPLSTSFCPITAVRAKRERRKEARPGELLAAALELFVEKGFAATRAEEVAKRAGVSKGTLFLYFASKEELFKAVVRENISGRFSAWSNEIDGYQGSSTDLLRYAVNTWWERVGSTQAVGISKLMMSEAGNFPELAAFYQAEVIDPGVRLIQRVLQRGIDSGEFRALDLHYGAYTVLAPMMFLAIASPGVAGCLSAGDMTLDPKTYLQFQLDNILFGLCTRPDQTLAPS